MCAPLIGPNARISAISAPAVARVFASSASATFPPASRSAMTPLPTTVASSSAVATISATTRRPRLGCVMSGSPASRWATDLEQPLHVPLQDRLRRELVVGPRSFAPGLHHGRVPEDPELAGSVRLRQSQGALHVADAQLAMAEQGDDPQAGFVPQRLEQARDLPDLEGRSPRNGWMPSRDAHNGMS